jgi:hypothetical protein
MTSAMFARELAEARVTALVSSAQRPRMRRLRNLRRWRRPRAVSLVSWIVAVVHRPGSRRLERPARVVVR